MSYVRIVVVLLTWALVAPLVFGAMEERNIEASGSGTDENFAIKAALSQAIGMVNGISIETKQTLNALQESTDSDQGSSFSFAEASSIQIEEMTKGVVKSYEVLSSVQARPDRYEVTILATIAVYKVNAAANRKRIAVLPLRGAAGYSLNGVELNTGRIVDATTQAVVNELVDSRRFTVLDRSYMAQLAAEEAILPRGKTPFSELVKLGQTLSADYVFVGMLENLQGGVRVVKSRTSDREFRRFGGSAQISYRVIDLATKQIRFSRTQNLSFDDERLRKQGMGSSSSIADKALGIAKIIGQEVGNTVIESIYPIMVVAANESGIVLGQGGEAMRAGVRFDIYRLGERMFDPYTKESIGRAEEKVATVEVTRSTSKQAYARLLSVEFDLVEAFQLKTFIARRAGQQQDIEESRVVIEKNRKERDKKRDTEQEELW